MPTAISPAEVSGQTSSVDAGIGESVWTATGAGISLDVGARVVGTPVSVVLVICDGVSVGSVDIGVFTPTALAEVALVG